MSDLSKRSLTKAVSRPNAKRALDRIAKELFVLISNAPLPAPGDGIERMFNKGSARAKVLKAIEKIEVLYK